jgi:uncharacterized protein (UPF0261 family)
MPERITILLIGTLDTKGREYAFLKEHIESRGFKTVTIDVGILDEPFFPPDIPRQTVAEAAGVRVEDLRARGDRGEAVAAMSAGIAPVVRDLAGGMNIRGVIALGGGGGTSIACSGMRALPPGIPKIMVSTLAGLDVSGYVSTSDIVMVPSLVDVAGLNRISRGVFLRAAEAVCAMAGVEAGPSDDRPLIAATMFGNTTPAVKRASRVMEEAGYEVVTFPCTGTSGAVMENLIDAGFIAGVLDITTTEWADQLVGGVLGAGETRLEAAARRGIPQVVVPGCLDMVNFWEPDTVPERFAGRRFYRHNPHITLMRTNVRENEELGAVIAEKLNRSTGDAAVFLPGRGLSMIDAPGGPFWWPEADRALFASLRGNLDGRIELVETDAHINDENFAVACAEKLLQFLKKRGERKGRGGRDGDQDTQ